MPFIIEKGVAYLHTKLQKVTQQVEVFSGPEEYDYSRQVILKRILMNPDYVKLLTIDECINKPNDIPVVIHTSDNDVFILGYIENKFIHVPNYEMYYSELLQKYPFIITGWKITGQGFKNFGINLNIRVYA